MGTGTWKRWAALAACCALVWGIPAPAVCAADRTAQNEQGISYDFIERLCGAVNRISGSGRHPVGSRRGEEAAVLLPQPMPGSTLLAGHRTRFAWGNQPHKVFSLKDEDSGKIVYRQEVEGQRELFLVPEEAGMRPDRTYLWEMDGDGGSIQRQVRLLDAAMDADMQKKLQSLETVEVPEEIKGIHRQVLQAVCLVMWSDESEGAADLYWQAIELLEQPGMDRLEDKTSDDLRRSLLYTCWERLNTRLP